MRPRKVKFRPIIKGSSKKAFPLEFSYKQKNAFVFEKHKKLKTTLTKGEIFKS